MTEITLQITQFIEYCAAMTEKPRSWQSDDGTLQSNGYSFRPVILMSLDMERELRRKAGAKFSTDKMYDFTTKYFCGIPVINIIADGYLSFCWEAEQ